VQGVQTSVQSERKKEKEGRKIILKEWMHESVGHENPRNPF
jgi:hypothetical protein